MIEFQPIRIEDRPLYEKYLSDGTERGCEYSFANLFLWGQQYAAIVHDHMVLLSTFMPEPATEEMVFGNASLYPYPIGKGDKKPVIDAIMADAKERGIPLRITGMCEESGRGLKELYPGQFIFSGSQDNDDYVYAIDDLADLSGRKYHRKKNHYNRFKKNYPDYRVEPFTDENIEKVREMALEWFRERKAENPDMDFRLEKNAFLKALEHYKELDLESMVLFVGNQPVGVTMASRISENTFDVHFEKARPEMDGAYTAINCEFAKYIRDKYPAIQYLNREEDMGLEGLRKAKESYYPHHMVQKCRAKWIGKV